MVLHRRPPGATDGRGPNSRHGGAFRGQSFEDWTGHPPEWREKQLWDSTSSSFRLWAQRSRFPEGRCVQQGTLKEELPPVRGLWACKPAQGYCYPRGWGVSGAQGPLRAFLETLTHTSPKRHETQSQHDKSWSLGVYPRRLAPWSAGQRRGGG